MAISDNPTLVEVNDVPAVVNLTLDAQIPAPSETVEPLEEIAPVTLTTVPSENDNTPDVTWFNVLTLPYRTTLRMKYCFCQLSSTHCDAVPCTAHSFAAFPSPSRETPPTTPSITPAAGDLALLADAVATVPAIRAMLTVAPVTGAVASPAGAVEVEEVLDVLDDVTIFVLEDDDAEVETGADVVTTELEG